MFLKASGSYHSLFSWHAWYQRHVLGETEGMLWGWILPRVGGSGLDKPLPGRALHACCFSVAVQELSPTSEGGAQSTLKLRACFTGHRSSTEATITARQPPATSEQHYFFFSCRRDICQRCFFPGRAWSSPFPPPWMRG